LRREELLAMCLLLPGIADLMPPTED
jgi:hypothetical protein